jgi:hypothetical protein
MQVFYLLFDFNPSHSKSCKNNAHENNMAKPFAKALQAGKNISNPFYFTLLQTNCFVNLNFGVHKLLYFLTVWVKICYVLYAINQGKVKLCQKLKIQMK